MRLAAKTLSYSVVHVAVAATLAYVLTGNIAIAIGIGLLEPLVQTLVYPLHEWLWERKAVKVSLFHDHSHVPPQSTQAPRLG